MHVEPSRLLALGVNQQPSTPNFSSDEHEARDYVSQQTSAKSVPNVLIIDGESR
jgi:CDP-diacylglycerol pyrophosphatase